MSIEVITKGTTREVFKIEGLDGKEKIIKVSTERRRIIADNLPLVHVNLICFINQMGWDDVYESLPELEELIKSGEDKVDEVIDNLEKKLKGEGFEEPGLFNSLDSIRANFKKSFDELDKLNEVNANNIELLVIAILTEVRSDLLDLVPVLEGTIDGDGADLVKLVYNEEPVGIVDQEYYESFVKAELVANDEVRSFFSKHFIGEDDLTGSKNFLVFNGGKIKIVDLGGCRYSVKDDRVRGVSEKLYEGFSESGQEIMYKSQYCILDATLSVSGGDIKKALALIPYEIKLEISNRFDLIKKILDDHSEGLIGEPDEGSNEFISHIPTYEGELDLLQLEEFN